MHTKYDHRAVEQKWQTHWQENDTHKTEDVAEGKENIYQLVEFPYPSGNLHVGHWYAFAVPDIRARYFRAQGKNVLYPIGFDAFGLPAENAAIKHGINPREWTYKNMDHMRTQIASMGASFDLSREVVTCDPSYYCWTQWLFLEFYRNDLVKYSTTEANWCPSCKTVLANEQVVDGHCERCGSEVQKKPMKQWQWLITEYADRLIDDLEDLDWPEEIKSSQRNWIGRSSGAEIEFQIANTEEQLAVFTTRPDTLYGVTYMVVAPEHEIIEQLKGKISNAEEVSSYIGEAKKKSEIERTNDTKEKTGVKLEGVMAINPINEEEIPVYMADYVLAGYGTGAIMAVPAHDARDFAFAKKYDINIVPVVDNDFDGTAATTGVGVLINSDTSDGMDSEEAKVSLTEKAGGKMTNTYRLRDWGVSRQRYWGVPIPMIHCDKCGQVPVPEEQLPVELPDVEDYLPSDEGQSPLSKDADFVNVNCPSCGDDAKRETDTLDTFVCSSWYFLRYADPRNVEKFADEEKLKNWMPVDLYSGGAEHTTMHLLYSRFVHKVLYDLGHVTTSEPYTRRMNRSLILGPDGNKMSKSKGNVIDPDHIVDALGADAMRMYLAFIGPYNTVSSYPWNPESIVGVRKFIERTWRLQEKVSQSIAHEEVTEIQKILHTCLKTVNESVEAFKLNTGVAALMTCINALEKKEGIGGEDLVFFLQMLAPYAPHITQEMWQNTLGRDEQIAQEPWPHLDESLLVESQIELVIQVNGKVRDKITTAAEQDDTALEEIARASEKIRNHIGDREVRKVIVIKGRMVNIVV